MEGVGPGLRGKDACELSGLRGRGRKGIAHPGNSMSKDTVTGDSLVECRGRKSHSEQME